MAALNIDDHDSDDENAIDLDKYEVNMDLGETGHKKRYKRLYDSKYKIPLAKKFVANIESNP